MQLLFVENHREAFSGNFNGKEKYLDMRLTPSTPKVFDFFCSRRWVTGCGDGGYPEKGSHAPRKKIGSNHNQGRADISRVRLLSLWYGPYTGLFGGLVLLHTGSVGNNHIESTAQD